MDRQYRILIVDDERYNIKALTSILKHDYKIMAARDGESALRAAQGNMRPDLVLLDIMMPGIDGYEVCRTLKNDERTRDIPVIFVTAVSESRMMHGGASSVRSTISRNRSTRPPFRRGSTRISRSAPRSRT